MVGRDHEDHNLNSIHQARHWWLMPIILATQEAEIRSSSPSIAINNNNKNLKINSIQQEIGNHCTFLGAIRLGFELKTIQDCTR
jgi:hypothetical protein